eukprot:4934832-Pleurochrysis_carterae.AAC.1
MSVDSLIPAVLPFVTLLGTHQLGCFASTYGYDAELGRMPNIVGHFAATLLGFTTLAVFGFYEWVIHEVEGAGPLRPLLAYPVQSRVRSSSFGCTFATPSSLVSSLRVLFRNHPNAQLLGCTSTCTLLTAVDPGACRARVGVGVETGGLPVV